MMYKNRMHQIRVNLVDILEIDTDKRYEENLLIQKKQLDVITLGKTVNDNINRMISDDNNRKFC